MSDDAPLKVVEMPRAGSDDIAKTLRAIADDIDARAYDFEPSLAIVVLGYEHTRVDMKGRIDHFRYQTHGLGNATFFAMKGLLASALSYFDGVGSREGA